MSLVLSNQKIEDFTSIENEIKNFLQDGKHDSFILIVPTNRKIRELKREYLHYCPNHISPAFQIYTLELLIKKIYSSHFELKYLVEGEFQSIFFEEAIKKLFKEKKLSYFHSRPDNKMPRGTFERVTKIISEFKENGIFPEDLLSDFDKINQREFKKVVDIINIYKEYNHFLSEKFIDKGDIYHQINNEFKSPFHFEIFKKIFPNVGDIFMTGFSDFSKPEITFLNTLLSLADIKTIFWFDYNEDNPFLFGTLKENIDNFDKNYLNRIPEVNITPNDFRTHIQRNLFKRFNTDEGIDFSEKVTLFNTKDRLEEVETICKIIRQIASENTELDLNKICVATSSTELYTNLFREVFLKYEIPVNVTDRYKLSSSPLISSIIAFLEIPLNNYRRKDIFRALLSPYFKFTKPDGVNIDSDNLFNMANSLKILYGEDLWIQKLERRLSFLNEIILNETEEDSKKFRKEKEKLEQAKSDFMFLKSLFIPIKDKLKPNEIKYELLKILNKLSISKQILNIKNEYKDFNVLEKDTRALTKFISILSDLKDIYAFKGESDNEHPLSYYLDDLKVIISNSLYNVKQKYGYGVFITAAEETRGLNFDYMFVAGLVEGEFPKIFKSEIFKSEIRRKTEEQHLMENRFLFYQTITNFVKKLFLSYSKFEEDKELIPSTFINSLKDIIQLKESLPETIYKTIYSKFDLQKLIGKSDNKSIENHPQYENFKDLYTNIKSRTDIEKSREKIHNFPEYEGYITNQLNQKEKDKLKFYLEKEFSISELEEYGKCPMKYFFGRVLDLEVFEEEDDDITALELGSILHETLFEFYHNRKLSNREFEFSLDNEKFQEAINDLRNISIRKIEELNITNPFFKIDFERIIGDGIKKRGILHSFLEYENSEEKAKRFMGMIYKPKYFEVSFGEHTGSKKYSDKDLSIKNSIKIDNIRMRGKVDRIDMIEKDDNVFFVIYDYKTGKVPDNYDIEEGTSLQIPIYLLAMKKLLSEKLGTSVKSIGGIYYILQTKIEIKPAIIIKDYFSSRSYNLHDEDIYNNKLQKSQDYVKKYVNDISNGIFKLPGENRDLNKICKYCNFSTICRVQSVKILDFTDSN